MYFGSAGAKVVEGDAIAIANMMVPSLCYSATVKAGPEGATLHRVRHSQYSSLMSQVTLTMM